MRLAILSFCAALAACSDPAAQPVATVGGLDLYRIDVDDGFEYEIRNKSAESVRAWLEVVGGTNHETDLTSVILVGGEAGYVGWAGPSIAGDPWDVDVHPRSRPITHFPELLRGRWIAVREFGTEQWAWPLLREEYGHIQSDVLVTDAREQFLLDVTQEDGGFHMEFESTSRMHAAPSPHREGVFDLYLLDEHGTRTLVLAFEVK